MSTRGKHLLEAFKVAGPNAAPPASGGTVSGAAGFSRGARALSVNAAQARLLGLVVVLLVVVAFLLGRMSVRGVAQAAGERDGAGERSGAADPQAPQEAPAQAQTDASPSAATAAASSGAAPAATGKGPVIDPTARTPAELALLDSANVYTIKLVHYSTTEANKRLAAETARYVQQTHNLPAVVATDASGLFILVGAAPRQVDLDEYLARVKRMSGPPPLSRPNEFHSAYVDKIDRLLRRGK